MARASGVKTPVPMPSRRSSDTEKCQALDDGADDNVPQSSRFDVLVARSRRWA
ncbi:MAG: hypothetical protein HYY06_31420 [Deltaproteobacteria bacterium]|nr:hypothetical protein [Deltaproteobacteria bacterium]